MKGNYIKLLLIIMIICMTVVYASINTTLSAIGNIKLANSSSEQLGIIFINATPINDSEEANDSTINKVEQTTTNFDIKLTNQDNSHITYKIRLFNNSDKFYRLKNIIDNHNKSNIIYTIDGLDKEKIISPNEYYDFYITYHYNDQNDKSNQTLKSIMEYEFEEISEEVLFADRVTTAKYFLSIINQMFMRIHELYNMLENSQYYDTTGIKEEMLALFKEIDWILNNTIVYNESLLNGTYSSNININNREYTLDLTNIANDISTDEEIFDDMSTLKMNMILLDNTIYEKLNLINTLKGELDSNNIEGHNLINVTEEANDAIAYIQVRENAIMEIYDILFRMEELTLRKENSNESAISSINSQIAGLISEIYRILEETKYNNKLVFETTIFNVNNKNIKFSAITKEEYKDLEDNYTTMNSSEFINIIHNKTDKVTKERSILGSYQSMLEYYLININ